MKKVTWTLGVAALTLISACAAPEGTGPLPQEPLSAHESDPQSLGWMQGFPPPDNKIIRFTDADYFAFPKLRWTVCHFRELMPSVAVTRGSGPAWPLPVALDPDIEHVTFTPLGGDTLMTWRDAFEANYTDGVLVIHGGKIVCICLPGVRCASPFSGT